MKQSDQKIEKIVEYYSEYDEQARLSKSFGQIEFLRTKNLISRYLNPPPAKILDVGGANGRYSAWLAEKGYEVHLIDPVPLHVEQAREVSNQQSETPIASCAIGDARQLEYDDEVADAILLLGPLYHLVDAQDRHHSLAEAYRVLKVGGYLFAAGISRFASVIDGLVSGRYLEPDVQKIMRQDLENGQHRNPTKTPGYFMETFFHHPDELKAEVENAGFQIAGLFAIEGISYMMKDFDESWEDENRRQFLLEIIAKIEKEQSLLGASPHIMCIGKKM